MCGSPKINLDDTPKIVPLLMNSKLDNWGANRAAAKGYQSLFIAKPVTATPNTSGVSKQSNLTIG